MAVIFLQKYGTGTVTRYVFLYDNVVQKDKKAVRVYHRTYSEKLTETIRQRAWGTTADFRMHLLARYDPDQTPKWLGQKN